MPKILNDKSEKKDCSLSVIVSRDQMDRFLELCPKDKKKSDLIRELIFEWMSKREIELQQKKHLIAH